jgi:phosphoribosylanthranilate isomerase
VKVKICGITSAADALMCTNAGADLLGLNFYPPSPRFISRTVAAEITAAVRVYANRPILVGVFVNETVATMQSIMDECGLDMVQLSGDEDLHVLESLGARGFKAIRRPDDPAIEQALTAEQMILFDAHIAGQYGGTARTADWQAAAELASRCRLLLAGGLTPENVAASVTRVRPWGVDVASGVESVPGVKDSAKVTSFIERAKQS